ncbi:hypothetical protein ACN28I_07625 [Archangium gephyra]|uniref:hypothetical protein n=1 Tax=Archangium gephyra TaxID=48 RepID=UPI003B784C88
MLSIIPNMLGFTLGGYAILIGFGDEQFKAIISGSDKKEQESPFLGTSAAFAHFIIIQLTALVSALVAKSLYFVPEPNSTAAKVIKLIPQWNRILDLAVPASWFFGYCLFIYSFSLALAATLAVFRMSYWFDEYQSSKNSSAEEDNQKK